MSVTSSVTLPPGLPATNPIDVEIQFGTAGMVHDTYNPTLGTQIAFDFPVNDGGSRSERLVVSLAERRPGGAVAMNFTTTVVIYPLFNIALSPLTFYLINDCDGIALWSTSRPASAVQHTRRRLLTQPKRCPAPVPAIRPDAPTLVTFNDRTRSDRR